MILRGWMVMLFGFLLGAFMAYLAMAFILWDSLFFMPPESDNSVRVAFLFGLVFGGGFGVFPFIEWAVDLDIRNRRR